MYIAISGVQQEENCREATGTEDQVIFALEKAAPSLLPGPMEQALVGSYAQQLCSPSPSFRRLFLQLMPPPCSGYPNQGAGNGNNKEI